VIRFVPSERDNNIFDPEHIPAGYESTFYQPDNGHKPDVALQAENQCKLTFRLYFPSRLKVYYELPFSDRMWVFASSQWPCAYQSKKLWHKIKFCLIVMTEDLF
jgi:hypothetical protein